MNRTRITIAALSAFTLAGALWLWQSAPQTSDTPATSPETADVEQSARTIHHTAQEEEGSIEQVSSMLEEWRTLHAPVGYLSQEETEALIAQRELTAAALAAAIARLRGEELEVLLDAFRSAERSRDKLVMIEGLAQNPHKEALGILEDIYADEGSYTLRSKVLRELGDSSVDGHHELLVDQMWSAHDERLQQLSAQALYGEGVASADMIEAVHSELPIKVRLEAIHSLGATGSDEAREALQAIADDPEMVPRVRAYAEKELGRSFG